MFFDILFYISYFCFFLINFPTICTQKSKHEGFGDIFDKLLENIPAPVDFELPDWLKKSKPMHFSYIRRSILKHSEAAYFIFCGCFPVFLILSKYLQLFAYISIGFAYME